MPNLPCFYFPTSVMFIDDNRTMLDNLCLNLQLNLPFKLYDEPQIALSSLQLQLITPELNSSFLHNNYSDDDEDQAVAKINFNQIRTLSMKPDRFSHVSTLVIDQSMPVLTGIEFCQHIHNSAIKKIMLTGEAGPSLAVDAFNQGLIDQFIIKATPNMTSQLKDNIERLQWNYFLQQSEYILAILKGYSECALFDSAYQSIVYDYFIKHSPCEFYLLDKTGSFLFIKSNGELSWIIVRSEQEMLCNYELAHDFHKEADLSLIFLNALKDYELIPFLFTKKQFALPINEWVKYSYKAQPVNDENRFYYTIIEGSKDYFSENGIVSFSKYLSSFDA